MTHRADDAGGCSGGEVFALRVLGDSMAPEFLDGEIIIVEPDGALREGSFVLAQAGGEWTLRQLARSGGGWTLHALQPGLCGPAAARSRRGARRGHPEIRTGPATPEQTLRLI